VSLKNLTATSIFSSVSRGTSRVNFSLTRCRKSSQFVCLLLEHGCFSRCIACVVSVTKTGESSEDRSKHDLTVAKNWEIPFVKQKSTRSIVCSCRMASMWVLPRIGVLSCFPHFFYLPLLFLRVWAGDKQPKYLGVRLSLPAIHWLLGGRLAYSCAADDV
jgi:hypothetical protein